MSKLTQAIPPGKYAQEGYDRCPNCGSEDIEGSQIEVDAQISWQDISCAACEASWRNTYKLTNYINPKNFTNPIPTEGVSIEIYRDDINENPFDEEDTWEFIQMLKGQTASEEYIKEFVGGEPVFADAESQRLYDNKQLFICSVYIHSGVVWNLKGEGPQDRFDTVSNAGILIWKGDVYEYTGADSDREKWARAALQTYNAWAGGEMYGFTLYKDDEALGACHGFHGDPTENSFLETIAGELISNNICGDDYEIQFNEGIDLDITAADIERVR